MIVAMQYFDGCPSWQTTDARLREMQDELGFMLVHELVETPEAAEAAQFRGSPTVRVDGHDPFTASDEPFGLACRIFQTPDGPAGSPTSDQLRAVRTAAAA